MSSKATEVDPYLPRYHADWTFCCRRLDQHCHNAWTLVEILQSRLAFGSSQIITQNTQTSPLWNSFRSGCVLYRRSWKLERGVRKPRRARERNRRNTTDFIVMTHQRKYMQHCVHVCCTCAPVQQVWHRCMVRYLGVLGYGERPDKLVSLEFG